MATGTSSAYPPPPPYYRLYKDYLEDPESAPEPPPPVQGTYPLFGATYTTDVVLPSLEDQGVRQLYPKGPTIDFKRELTSLNRELQLHILELADVLVERPSQYARRVEDISLIFKNLHHLLNSLRPHQARATLIHILERQIQQRKQAIEDIKRRREEAQRLLKESLQNLDGHLA
ncbi:mediator of RNA polymerase II transcription subunit 7a-like [Musa acuminata AAA Group]|uniref:Mediator of RNA polymerase II transcription subunit 7 n=2 Tax=Musa acuminata TaxID=4641 RepID=A0A804KCG5_MUSAM|nr:PREDICTED: mediator of RNA polymerase II transcription subunit 7a [Musa acuminata subsp. malaccensis]XP_009414932.1 PREDICTED: mediator of RNA polymerase II transcription subunit 7a [Musa acuminata subsp. malaccensis]